MNLLILAVLGVVEAVIYLWRMRAAVGESLWHNAGSACAITTTRVAFVLTGASAAMKGDSWPLVLVAYAVPATVATVLAHQLAERWKSKRPR